MEELDLKELCKMFWNKKMKILLITIIFIIIGIAYSKYFVKPVYSSEVTLILASTNTNATINNAGITTTDLTINSKLISTYSELVKSKSVLRQVIYNLGIDIEEETLRKNVKVTAVKNADIIKITVTNENKYYAAKIANEISEVFVNRVKSIYNIDNIREIDKAETPDEPSNINLKRDILIFAIIGLAVSVFYVLIDNMLDTTIKSAEEIETSYHMPVLASIPIYEEEAKKGKNGKKGGKE